MTDQEKLQEQIKEEKAQDQKKEEQAKEQQKSPAPIPALKDTTPKPEIDSKEIAQKAMESAPARPIDAQSESIDKFLEDRGVEQADGGVVVNGTFVADSGLNPTDAWKKATAYYTAKHGKNDEYRETYQRGGKLLPAGYAEDNSKELRPGSLEQPIEDDQLADYYTAIAARQTIIQKENEYNKPERAEVPVLKKSDNTTAAQQQGGSVPKESAQSVDARSNASSAAPAAATTQQGANANALVRVDKYNGFEVGDLFIAEGNLGPDAARGFAYRHGKAKHPDQDAFYYQHNGQIYVATKDSSTPGTPKGEKPAVYTGELPKEKGLEELAAEGETTQTGTSGENTAQEGTSEQQTAAAQQLSGNAATDSGSRQQGGADNTSARQQSGQQSAEEGRTTGSDSNSQNGANTANPPADNTSSGSSNDNQLGDDTLADEEGSQEEEQMLEEEDIYAESKALLEAARNQNKEAIEKAYGKEIGGYDTLYQEALKKKEALEAENKKKDRKEQAFRYITGIGDIVSGFANLVGTAKGASHQDQTYLAPEVVKKAEAAREARKLDMEALNKRLDELRLKKSALESAKELKLADNESSYATSVSNLNMKNALYSKDLEVAGLKGKVEKAKVLARLAIAEEKIKSKLVTDTLRITVQQNGRVKNATFYDANGRPQILNVATVNNVGDEVIAAVNNAEAQWTTEEKDEYSKALRAATESTSNLGDGGRKLEQFYIKMAAKPYVYEHFKRLVSAGTRSTSIPQDAGHTSATRSQLSETLDSL